jgi:hypothetical protein
MILPTEVSEVFTNDLENKNQEEEVNTDKNESLSNSSQIKDNLSTSEINTNNNVKLTLKDDLEAEPKYSNRNFNLLGADLIPQITSNSNSEEVSNQRYKRRGKGFSNVNVNNFSEFTYKKVGFTESVIIRKKTYFKNMKNKKEEREKESMKIRRMEMLTKLMLYVVSNIINLLSVICYVIQTYFDKAPLSDADSQYIGSVMDSIEITFSIYFLLEFVFLFFRRKVAWYKHLFTVDSFIDLITIVPSIAAYAISEGRIKINFIRIFRLFRVFRILRIYKSLKMIQYDMAEDGDLGFLNESARINPIKLQIITILVILFCLFFITAGLVLGLQDLLDNAFSVKNMNFFDAIYFTIITNVSVGYGDIVPTHPVSRIFVIVILFTLIVVVSDQVSKIVALLSIWGEATSAYYGEKHYIIICDNSFNLPFFLETIRKNDTQTGIVILSKDIKSLPSKEFPYNRATLIHAVNYDIEIFERANTKDAQCIFIITNKDLMQCDAKEKVNDFLILKINRYYQVPIYVQTLYSERSGTISKNILVFKKIIPILRIKTNIISKSLFNPGFATFAQNLLFNDINVNIKELDNYDTAMQCYLLGCENKIVIKPLPAYFVGKEFMDVLILIYAKSISDFFIKVSTDSKDKNRPVLLIGVLDVVSKMYQRDPKVKLYPSDYVIKPNTQGIFIAYNGENYIDKVLGYFPSIERDASFIDVKQFKRNKILTPEAILHLFKSSKECEEVSKAKEHVSSNVVVNSEENNIINNGFKRYFQNSNSSVMHNEFYSPLYNENNRDLNKSSFKNVTIIPAGDLTNPKIDNNEEPKQLSPIRLTTGFNKNNIIRGFNQNKFQDHNTSQNLAWFERFEEDESINLAHQLEAISIQRYNNEAANFDNKKLEFIIDHRIFNVEKTNLANFFENHILIIGYQDNLSKLLKLLFYHFKNKKICILTDKDEIIMQKLLKQYKDLIYIKGEAQNPIHLLNSGIQRAYYVLFLCENIFARTNEDMEKILSFKAIDYFFNCNMLLELWDHQSIKFLGYMPMENNSKLNNEFMHPLYMAGRLIYLSYFDKILAYSFFKEKEVEAWTSLLNLGFESVSSPSGHITFKADKDGEYPIILTVDVPVPFYGKEYHELMNHFFSFDRPCIGLGVYIENPLSYMSNKSLGKVSTQRSSTMRIINSHKRLLKNLKAMDKVEQGYMDNMKILRDISYNDKIILDYVDIRKTHLPIFITNPPPHLILEEGFKVMLLTHYKNRTRNTVMRIKNIFKKRKEPFAKNINNPMRSKLTETQENTFLYINILKEKLTKSISDAFKYLDE